MRPGWTTMFVSSMPDVKWSVVEKDGGSISANGLYLAPSKPGTYHVKATSWAGEATAKVSVNVSGAFDGLAGDTAWPSYRGQANNSGVAAGTIPAFQGRLKFKLPQAGTIFSSFAIGRDNTIYFGGDGDEGGFFRAVPLDGGRVWQRRVEQATFNGTAAIDANDTIYVGDSDRTFYALNYWDGSTKWTFTGGGGTSGSPTVDAYGTIIFGSDDGFVYGLNQSGGVKWKFRTGGRVFSSPALSKNQTVYIGSNDGNLYAIDSDTGAEVWRFAAGSEIVTSPALDDAGNVYFASNEGRYFSLTPGGALRWSPLIGAGAIIRSPAVLPDGTSYIWTGHVNDGGTLHAVKPDGTEKWKVLTDERSQGSAAAVSSDGTIFFTADHTFYAVTPAGSVKWKYVAEGSTSFLNDPVIGKDGTVYAAGPSRQLYAFE